MIPIIAIVLGIGIGMLAIYLSYRKRKELFALYHQERMAAIEKGIDCPPWPERLLADESLLSLSAPAPAQGPGLALYRPGSHGRASMPRLTLATPFSA